MIVTGKSDYYIDVCIELDTQAVSYLKNVFQEYDKKPNYVDIKDLINTIECYKNIKSYMLFKSFN